MKNSAHIFNEIIDRVKAIILRLKSIDSSEIKDKKIGLERLNIINAELDDLQSNIKSLKNYEKSYKGFKVLNFWMSIIPTIIATVLTIYVFVAGTKIYNENKKLNKVIQLKDSVVEYSDQIVEMQDSLISTYGNYIHNIKNDSLQKKIREIKNKSHLTKHEIDKVIADKISSSYYFDLIKVTPAKEIEKQP
jgi:hypothetical protein